jgi:hypothetical protein
MLLKTQSLTGGCGSHNFPYFNSDGQRRRKSGRRHRPIDQVNCSAGTYRVLGISFKATQKSVISGLCGSQSAAGPAYVVAGGLRSDSGKIVGTDLAEVQSELYVAGGSVVFVRGTVSRINATHRRI